MRVWDGSSPGRNPANYESPNAQDWDYIVKEVQAVQQYTVDQNDKYPADLTSMPKGLLVRLLPDGSLVPASSLYSEVAGMVISKSEYARRGRVYSEDWTDIAGSVGLEIGRTYFLRQFGQMRTESPTEGYIIPVGQAQTAMLFDFSIGTTVKV